MWVCSFKWRVFWVVPHGNSPEGIYNIIWHKGARLKLAIVCLQWVEFVGVTMGMLYPNVPCLGPCGQLT